MKYTKGKPGRIFVARFEDREDILKKPAGACKKGRYKGRGYLSAGWSKERKDSCWTQKG